MFSRILNLRNLIFFSVKFVVCFLSLLNGFHLEQSCCKKRQKNTGQETGLGNRVRLELVSKELNHLAAILHVYAGGLNFMK